MPSSSLLLLGCNDSLKHKGLKIFLDSHQYLNTRRSFVQLLLKATFKSEKCLIGAQTFYQNSYSTPWNDLFHTIGNTHYRPSMQQIYIQLAQQKGCCMQFNKHKDCKMKKKLTLSLECWKLDSSCSSCCTDSALSLTLLYPGLGIMYSFPMSMSFIFCKRQGLQVYFHLKYLKNN